MGSLLAVLAPPHSLGSKHLVRAEFLGIILPLTMAAHFAFLGGASFSDYVGPKAVAAVLPLVVATAFLAKDALIPSLWLFDNPAVSNKALQVLAMVFWADGLSTCVRSDPCIIVRMLAGLLFGCAWTICPMLGDCRVVLLLTVALSSACLLKLLLCYPDNNAGLYEAAKGAATEQLVMFCAGATVRLRLRMHGQRAPAALTAASLQQMHRSAIGVWDVLGSRAPELSAPMERSIAKYVRGRKRAKNDLVAYRILLAHLARPANACKRLPTAAADCIRHCFQSRPVLSLAQCVSTCAERQLRCSEDQVSKLGSEATSGVSSMRTRTSMTSIQLTWRRLKRDAFGG